MDCTEAYKEHIMYSFNGFCKVVIRYAAINAWRDRNRRRQREISFEYLTEEKFYPLSTSDEALKSPYEQYPVTICGQTIILTNGELAAALLSLPEKKREIIYLYFFGNYTQQEMRDWEHIAVKYYKDYHAGSAKTLKSIQITLAARLEKFNLRSLAALTATDELDLPSLGEKKVALFALIPDNDTSFNFLVSILYTQLFQQLFYLADNKYGGSLPIPVHFLMDEFSNVSLPDDFDKILAVMRSRNISVSIILQNIAQLKALFEKQWESIIGNCDEFLYLGGNEQSTHKYVSELLGKETIDMNTSGQSKGHSGSYSTNWQITGRELLDAAEVRMLDNRYALLFIRGERPILDEKYDILKHPDVAFSADGKAMPYEHGKTDHAIASISFAGNSSDDIPEIEIEQTDYELLSDEDVEALFL